MPWFVVVVRVLGLGVWCTRSRNRLKIAWSAPTQNVTLCLAHVVMLQPALSAHHVWRNVCCARSQFSLERRYATLCSVTVYCF